MHIKLYLYTHITYIYTYSISDIISRFLKGHFQDRILGMKDSWDIKLSASSLDELNCASM